MAAPFIFCTMPRGMDDPNQRHILDCGFRHLGWLNALCVVVFLMAATAVEGAESGRGWRILMISAENRFLPATILVERSVQDTLQKLLSGRFEFYAEYLDTSRFPGESHHRLFHLYLREKYAQRPPDLIIVYDSRNFELVETLSRSLFPDLPLVTVGVIGEDEVPRERLGANVTGVVARADLRGTMELIMQAQPETRRIVMVAGTSALDRTYVDRAKKAAQSLAGKVEFEFLTNLTFAEVPRVVGSMSPRTAILFASMLRDSAGEALVRGQVAEMIAKSANVPVYNLFDIGIGRGHVGGYVVSLEGLGKRAGEIAHSILNGATPASLPFEIRTEGVPMFDWRALQRWGISERRLPPGSVVQFREPTIWQRYRWQISAVAALCLAQTLLIAGLLIQRRRRRRAEREVESLAGRLITAQEAERSRIAGELHDDVNQQLAGLSIALSNVKRQLQNGADGTVQEEISRLQQRTIDLADVIRNLSHELHPGVLQHAGLVAALEGHCAEVGRQYPIEVTFSAVDGLNGIPQDVALCLYRVAQEALRNIAVHAAAHKAQVTLSSSEKGLELVIADDGQGFNLAEARGFGGLGLISLDERVRLIGGSLTINTEPQHGTEVRVQVPLGGNR